MKLMFLLFFIGLSFEAQAEVPDLNFQWPAIRTYDDDGCFYGGHLMPIENGNLVNIKNYTEKGDFYYTVLGLYAPESRTLQLPTCRGPVYSTAVKNHYIQVADKDVYAVEYIADRKSKWSKIGTFSFNDVHLIFPKVVYSEEANLVVWTGHKDALGWSRNVLVIWDLKNKKSYGPIEVGMGYEGNSAALVLQDTKEIVVASLSNTSECAVLSAYDFQGRLLKNFDVINQKLKSLGACVNKSRSTWSWMINLGFNPSTQVASVAFDGKGSKTSAVIPHLNFTPDRDLYILNLPGDQVDQRITVSRANCEESSTYKTLEVEVVDHLHSGESEIMDMRTWNMSSNGRGYLNCSQKSSTNEIVCESAYSRFYFAIDPLTKRFVLDASYTTALDGSDRQMATAKCRF